MAKKTNSKKEEVINLDAILFKCRDILRQAKIQALSLRSEI